MLPGTGPATIGTSDQFALADHSHGVSIGGGAIANEFLLADLYEHKDFSYTGNKLTQIDIYDDLARLTLLYVKVFSYSGNNLTSIVMTRQSDMATFTKTLTYSGNNLTMIDYS